MAKAKKEKMEANPFKLKKELPHLPGYIIVILWTAFIFCMIGWIILASLSTTKEIFTGGLLASGLHFENYTKALFTNKAALNLLNSVIYTVPSCILIIVVCAPAAYCMSRFKFRGAGLIQALIIIGLAIPNIMIVMPLFSVVSALNLSGTHFTLIFLYTACSVPYTTFFLLTFFKGISTSFEEAAAIDGCGPIQCFWKIMFPLAQPAIVTVSIFNFIGKWNEYFMALINALGIGYGSNITIRNITFRDCYNGHVIQVAGSDNVLIENCRFEGQSFRGSGDKTRELLQIEPGTVKGYPYTLVQNKAPSTNVTIRNCYFGGSENTPHYMAAIGTHSQQAGVKCSDIVIEDCTFDNAAYTAIHFMAYDRITIRNNIFTITSDSEQIDRYGILADTYGSFIDPTGAESTTDFTIEGNTFDVSDPKATVLEITTNNKSPKHIKNVTIKDNTLKGVNGGKAIDLYLLDNCTISGNTIEGFERPIVANSCDEQFISDTDIVTE